MLPLSQRHKEEPPNKAIPIACTLFFLLLILQRCQEKGGKAGEFQKFRRNLTVSFFCACSKAANFICQFYQCNCLQPLQQLRHCWGTDCSSLQQANHPETFRILRHSFFPILLTPTHFTLLESLHYSLQVLPHTDSKSRTTIPDSSEKDVSVFQSGKGFMEKSCHFLCCLTYRRGINAGKCEFFGRIRPFNNTYP